MRTPKAQRAKSGVHPKNFFSFFKAFKRVRDSKKKNDEQASSITIMKCKAVARLDETEKLLKKYEKIEL